MNLTKLIVNKDFYDQIANWSRLGLQALLGIVWFRILILNSPR